MGFLVSRVFYQYLNVIKFQKQSSRYVHILLTVLKEENLSDSKNVDSKISSQSSNIEELPLPWGTVSSCMMNGPYGAGNTDNVCMRDNECSKDFPKDFRDHKYVNMQGYTKS